MASAVLRKFIVAAIATPLAVQIWIFLIPVSRFERAQERISVLEETAVQLIVEGLLIAALANASMLETEDLAARVGENYGRVCGDDELGATLLLQIGK